MAVRQIVWRRLATDWKLDVLDRIATEVSLEDLDPYFDVILRGGVTGRILVRIAGGIAM
jgi:hypothetical protein